MILVKCLYLHLLLQSNVLDDDLTMETHHTRGHHIDLPIEKARHRPSTFMVPKRKVERRSLRYHSILLAQICGTKRVSCTKNDSYMNDMQT